MDLVSKSFTVAVVLGKSSVFSGEKVDVETPSGTKEVYKVDFVI